MNVLLRRITALLAMIAIAGLVLLLMWDVYLHHRHAGGEDEPTSVTAPAPPAPGTTSPAALNL